MSYDIPVKMDTGKTFNRKKCTVLIDVNGEFTDEMKNDFESKYGAIRMTNNVGPVYKFIIFEDRTSANKCMEDLKDHPEYNARVPIDKHDKPKQDLERNDDEESKKFFNKSVRRSGEKNKPRDFKNFVNHSPPPAEKRMPREGSYIPLRRSPTQNPSEEVSNVKDVKQNKLIYLQDYRDYKQILKRGFETMTGIVVANFPIAFMQCDVYGLCDPFVKVFHVEIRNKMIPTEMPFAYVFVESEEAAAYLVKKLNGMWFRNKPLISFKVSDVAGPEDIIEPEPLKNIFAK